MSVGGAAVRLLGATALLTTLGRAARSTRGRRGCAGTTVFRTARRAFRRTARSATGPPGRGCPRSRHPLLSYPAHYATSAAGRRQLAMTVLYGMFGEITVEDKRYDFKMPDFARLDDATLAATLNFVVFDLDHAPASVKPLSAADIAAERAQALDGAAVREHRKSVAPAGS